MSEKSRARKVQRATELPYLSCLRLVRGEYRYTPLSPACEVRAALLAATKGRYVPPEGVREVPCPCFECDDGS
jgi:hypothetical protein